MEDIWFLTMDEFILPGETREAEKALPEGPVLGSLTAEC
jgi:hypothetical protein